MILEGLLMEQKVSEQDSISRVKKPLSFQRLDLVGSLIFFSLILGAASSWFLTQGLTSPFTVAGIAIVIFIILVLAATRFDLLVLAAFGLLGFVSFEPAPSDLLFLLLIAVLLFKERERLKSIKPFPLIHLAVFIFLATNFTALDSIRSPMVAARYVLITIYLLSFFYFSRLYVNSRPTLKIVLSGYLLAASISALVAFSGLFNFGILESQILFGGQRWDGYFRLQGFFKDPNVFGPFLVPGILLLFEDLRHPGLLRGPRLLKMAILILLTLAVIFSFSRAGYLNLGVAILFYLLILAKTEHLKDFALTVGLVVLILLIPVLTLTERPDFFGLNLEKTKNIVFSSQTYDTARFAAQEKALKVGVSKPFGIGPGQYHIRYRMGTHSLYLRVLAEQGWLGITALLMLIATIIVFLLRVIRFPSSPFQRSLATIVLASLIAILANSFFIDTLHWRHFWLLLGLAWAIRESSVFVKEKVG